MKKHRELKISGNKAALKKFLKTLKNNLPDGWINKKENEISYSKTVNLSQEEVGCFESPNINGKVTFIWLLLENDILRITNVVPGEVGELSIEEYNRFVKEFHDQCLSQTIIPSDIEIYLSPSDVSIEEIAGEETAQKLKAWAYSANPSTGNTHPSDQEKWKDFLFTAFINNSNLDSYTLERWLVEEMGWKNYDTITKLIVDYEYGLDLLKYEKYRKSPSLQQG